MSEVKYPDVDVQLTGRDGNAFMIIGTVISSLRSHGVHRAEIEKYVTEAQSGDYDNLLATTMRWVNVS